jgi:hypothetical protein
MAVGRRADVRLAESVSTSLRVRYDRRVDIHEAFLSLGCVWICWKSLRKDWLQPERSRPVAVLTLARPVRRSRSSYDGALGSLQQSLYLFGREDVVLRVQRQTSETQTGG